MYIIVTRRTQTNVTKVTLYQYYHFILNNVLYSAQKKDYS